MGQNDLEQFLRGAENTVSREKLLDHRFRYDCQLAAAERGYHLVTLGSEVDRDGYDVAFSDGDSTRFLQEKTCEASSGSAWDIWKGLLRPGSSLIHDALAFEFSPSGIGTEGGFVLIEWKANGGALEVTYSFTDIYVIAALAYGVIPGPKPLSRADAGSLLRDLTTGLGRDRVSVRRSVLLTCKDAGSLLALAGLHAVPRFPSWFLLADLIAAENNRLGGRVLSAPPHELRRILQEMIAALTM
jgi:hypothetical protein